MGCGSSKGVVKAKEVDYDYDESPHQPSTSSDAISIQISDEVEASRNALPLKVTSDDKKTIEFNAASDDFVDKKKKLPLAIPLISTIEEGDVNMEFLSNRITDEEKEKMKLFLEAYELDKDKEGELYPDPCAIIRSLRHGNYNIKKSLGIYRNFARWHKLNVLDVSNNEPLSDEKRAVLEACYFQYFAPGFSHSF
jgi:hypothetical protein